MSQRTFEELLACMRTAAGSDAEALALVTSFEETVTVISLSDIGVGEKVRTDQTDRNPSRVLLLFPPGLDVSAGDPEDEDGKPIAFIEEMVFEGDVRLDTIHLLGDECPPDWLGLQLVVMWHNLLECIKQEDLRREYEQAVQMSREHGASGVAVKAQIESAQRQLGRTADKSRLALFHLTARLLDAKLDGELTRHVSHAPRHLSVQERGDWLGQRIYHQVAEPPMASQRDEDTRDFIVSCALNWFVGDEPKTVSSHESAS